MKKLTRAKIYRFLREHATDKEVLNIGAGDSVDRVAFPNMTTLDLDPSYHPDIVGDIHHLPIEDESFDVIICSEVMEHVRDPRQAVNEMRRVLRPGGVLLVTTRSVFPVHREPLDFWRYMPDTLQELFSDWKECRITPEALPFTTLGALVERIIFQTDVRGGKFTKGGSMRSRASWVP